MKHALRATQVLVLVMTAGRVAAQERALGGGAGYGGPWEPRSWGSWSTG